MLIIAFSLMYNIKKNAVISNLPCNRLKTQYNTVPLNILCKSKKGNSNASEVGVGVVQHVVDTEMLFCITWLTGGNLSRCCLPISLKDSSHLPSTHQ